MNVQMVIVPATVRSQAIDEAINKLGQVSATMRMVLEQIFAYDTIDLKGSKDEIFRAIEVCHSYPAWREILNLVWEQIIAVRESLAEAEMSAEKERAAK